MYCPFCGRLLVQKDKSYFCEKCDEIIIPNEASLLYKIQKEELCPHYSSFLKPYTGDKSTAIILTVVSTVIFIVPLSGKEI